MKPTPKQPTARYSDGHPLDEVHYLESKIITRGDEQPLVGEFAF